LQLQTIRTDDTFMNKDQFYDNLNVRYLFGHVESRLYMCLSHAFHNLLWISTVLLSTHCSRSTWMQKLKPQCWKS